MKLVDQDIPAELYRAYERSLGFAQEYKEGSGIFSIKKRQPYNLPHMRSDAKRPPSAAQLAVRATFLKCVDCFNKSPRTGGAVPPAVGYRSKEWWYQRSLDPPVQNWKKTELVTWAGYDADPYQLKDTNYNYHDANWFLKTDEQDFIDFYNEMKTKWGYPWSAKNDPDQIVTRMNQIVCVEITYDHEGDMSVCFTPGQTAQARKGVCDDQSALHYALTWKALKELGWADGDINNRLCCVINLREDNGHIYNWWRSNAGGTRIVENTYNLGNMPLVIGDMQYWGEDAAKYLVQRFDKAGHYEPVWTYPETTLPLWYYNYFIKYTWPVFWDDDVPDWCKLPPNWTERRPAGDVDKYWRSVASDSNGSHLIAGIQGGRLYTSSDDGVNWTERRPAGDVNRYWYSVASDSDGSNLIVGDHNSRLYTSSDGGVNWTERRPAGDVNKPWYCVASDSNGSHLIAGIQGGRLYTSSDGGVNWTERRPAGDANIYWYSVASDSDGSHLIAAAGPGRLYTSSNYGVNWTERRPAGDANKYWHGIAIDSDGSHLIAGDWDTRLYTSSDGGVNWTERRPAGDVNKDWYCVASDSNGSHLIAGVFSGRLYTSSNGGVNWIEERPAGDIDKNWSCAASDSDGSRLIVGVSNSRLYTYKQP